MSYAEDHASALADVQEAGTAVAFTLDIPGTHVPTTGRFTGAATQTVSGYAIKVKGEGADKGMQGGEVIEQAAQRLFFVASTYGDVPPPNSRATWSGSTWRVAKTRCLAPDGVAIATYVELE